jgi:hypothetical protein
MLGNMVYKSATLYTHLKTFNAYNTVIHTESFSFGVCVKSSLSYTFPYKDLSFSLYTVIPRNSILAQCCQLLANDKSTEKFGRWQIKFGRTHYFF